MANDDVIAERVQRLNLLASALSGYALRVAPVEPGTPAWTDGRTVFLDSEASTRSQVEALAVQASLLAAGSLEPNVLRRLVRRRTLARRYLAVEAHRALAANSTMLPPRVRSLIDRDMAARSDSPAASLEVALSRQPIADPPEVFGVIRARNVLVGKTAHRRRSRTGASSSGGKVGRGPSWTTTLVASTPSPAR